MEFNQAYDPFRALQTSWQAIKKAPLALLIGGVLLAFTDGQSGNFGSSFDPEREVDWEVMMPLIVGMIGLSCCIAIGCFVFSSWVRIGFSNCVEEALRTGDADVGKVFDGKGRLVTMMLARLLAGLIMLPSILPVGVAVLLAVVTTDNFERNEGVGAVILVGGFVLGLIVWAYLGLGVWFTKQVVALEGLQPVEAVRRSWSLASGHRWMLFWYWLVTTIFAIIGICACCIGYLLTGPMAEVARTESFLAFTRGKDRAGWWIHTGTAPVRSDPGWGSPAELSSKPVGWGAPPPSPPPPPTPPSAY